jgi:hypothetical protein
LVARGCFIGYHFIFEEKNNEIWSFGEVVKVPCSMTLNKRKEQYNTCAKEEEDSTFYYIFWLYFKVIIWWLVNSCISMVELIRKLLIFIDAWGWLLDCHYLVKNNCYVTNLGLIWNLM